MFSLFYKQVLSHVFGKNVVGKLSYFLESNGLLSSSQFSSQESLFSWTSQLYLLGGSHCSRLHYLRCIGVGGQFSFIASEFLNDRRQRVRLVGKVRASVDVVSGVSPFSGLEPLLFILYTSEFFYIPSYSDDTTIYAVIPRQIRVLK